jgi:RNA polymerase sigma-70 factor, ECF subfamily
VIELNRAVAISMAFGPHEALPLVDALAKEPIMQRYHLLHAVRADLLAKLGRKPEAIEALQSAMELASNERERQLLKERMHRLIG